MDYGFYNWMVKIKNETPFSNKEWVSILVSIGVMTLIVGFNDGREVFDPAYFLFNLILSLVAVSFAVLIHEFAHRITAVNLGYKAEFKISIYGLLAGALLALVSYGKILILAHGSFYLNIMEKHRLGYFRHYLGYFDNGKVAIAGPLANLAAAMFFSMLSFMENPLIDKLILVNALIAIIQILPIPFMDGGHVMYAARKPYPVIMSVVVGAAAMLIVTALDTQIPFDIPWWGIPLGALLIGILGTLLFMRIEEKYF